MNEFKREYRYIVIKRSDLDQHAHQALDRQLYIHQIRTRECVVIESDWPIYEAAWDMVQRLAEGREQRIAELERIVEQFKAAAIKASTNGYGQDDVHHDDSWIDELDDALRRIQLYDAKRAKEASHG